MKIAFIGLGRMGQAMAARLLGAGHDVIVYNRTASKTAALVKQGARQADSAIEAAREAGVVMTMLADDAALAEVTQGAQGLIRALPRGGVHLAMGTHSVQKIRELAAAHAEAGQTLLSAPVLGRPEAVTAGKLGVIVAGESAAQARCRPLLDALGRRVFVAGDKPEAAAALKLTNNFLLACTIEAIGEAFSLVRKSGVESSVLHDVLTDGLFACPAYNVYSKIISERDYDHVGFSVALGLKDVKLALAAGEAAGVPLPSANVCRDRLLGAIAHGDGERDWSAMALEQARASGLD